MFSGLIRLILLVVVLVAAAFFVFGFWTNGAFRSTPSVTEIKTPRIDTEAARERGAELGERAAVAAARVGETLEEGGLTAKIKAKMVLDDMVKARDINVTTNGTTVTLTGTVHSQRERDRANALARETEGVTQVVDHLTMRQI
jgi:hyperosmotically inducible periplasmic protein